MKHPILEAGNRVMTPEGLGTVVYRRMAPPDFKEPASYCVRLDALMSGPEYRLSYTGTIYPASLVRPVRP